MQDFAARLALGTAQLGLAYGINNTVGQPSLAQAATLLAAAQAAGVTMLDTAAAYGDSETRLGQLLPTLPAPAFQLVTKLAAGPRAEVAQRLAQSLERLGRPALHGLLFHDFEGQRQWPEAWQALMQAQDAGQVQRLGVSVYHPWQVEWLLEHKLPVSLVQLPLNVLDQRFVPWLPALAAAGIEVHCRSVFLQGLLLRHPQDLPSFFSPLQAKLHALGRLASQQQVPLQALLLLFVAAQRHIGRLVVGVDTVENLTENVSAGAFWARVVPILPELATFAETDDSLILPYLWPR